ncbi:MAG: hypothetical protein A2X36_14405 [Elusimicrobia bacterium GWA2_69_24]|nr:MAG: hypothetical protein A2X36_14405 [Elusimicrobia bacterium GWA2_69_24]HBL18416.1 Crp/Fnr family transcriptional regulator [Elusimicrobiota bacterium]
MRPVDDFIRNHPIFQDFRPDHLELVTSVAEEMRFTRDQYLLRQGQGAERFFIIRKGLVRIELLSKEGETIPIQEVGPGDLLGWSWLLPPYKWGFDARAAETTLALVFDGASLRKKCEQNFEFGFRFLQVISMALSRRLDVTRAHLLEYYSQRPHPWDGDDRRSAPD